MHIRGGKSDIFGANIAIGVLAGNRSFTKKTENRDCDDSHICIHFIPSLIC